MISTFYVEKDKARVETSARLLKGWDGKQKKKAD